MNKKEIVELLSTIEDYLSSLPRDYSPVLCGKDWNKEYRHGRMRKVWNITVKLTR